jgi:hypothetical protein
MTMTDDELAALAEPTLPPEEVPARRLPGQRFRVELDGAEPFEVRVVVRDRVAYEKTAAKQKWPDPQAAPNLAMTFLTWTAAKREGLTALTFEQWEARLEDFNAVEDEPADPTRPAAGAG